MLKQIERAILASDIGITPGDDGRIIRLTNPLSLTEENVAVSLKGKLNEWEKKQRSLSETFAGEAIDKAKSQKKQAR